MKNRLPMYLPVRRLKNRSEKNRYLSLLNKFETMESEEVSNWQLRKVINIVNYAFKHVPFYKKLYREVGYKCGDITSWETFYQLPLITKNDIKYNLSQVTSDDYLAFGGEICYTGGSTDKPMRFYVDKHIRIREDAFFEYYWKKNGYFYGEKCVLLRGQQIENGSSVRAYTALDQTQHYLVCDSRFITEYSKFKIIDKSIKKFGARVLQAYPSSAYSLAKAYTAAQIEAPHFDLIFLGSENTYPDQLDYLYKVFSPKKITYHYGHSECVTIAIKYDKETQMGFCPAYGITELLLEGRTIAKNSKMGEIVATGFNHSTPFIRYRTGDYAISSSYKSDDYMRNYFSVERIEGRQHEFIVTKDNRLVSLCMLPVIICNPRVLLGTCNMNSSKKEIW